MTTAYDADPCPACGEEDNLRWQASTPTTDTWVCRECGYTWLIEVDVPAQTDTELTERAEIHG